MAENLNQFFSSVFTFIIQCLHTGHWNEDVHYTMGGRVLSTTTTEKDLGVIVNADMKGFRAMRNGSFKGKSKAWLN